MSRSAPLRPRRAHDLDIGVRLGLPLLGMLAGSQLGPRSTVCDDSSSCASDGSSIGVGIGAGLGALAAAALDAGLLARKRIIEAAPPLAPTIGYHHSGFTVGLAGSF